MSCPSRRRQRTAASVLPMAWPSAHCSVIFDYNNTVCQRDIQQQTILSKLQVPPASLLTLRSGAEEAVPRGHTRRWVDAICTSKQGLVGDGCPGRHQARHLLPLRPTAPAILHSPSRTSLRMSESVKSAPLMLLMRPTWALVSCGQRRGQAEALRQALWQRRGKEGRRCGGRDPRHRASTRRGTSVQGAGGAHHSPLQHRVAQVRPLQLSQLQVGVPQVGPRKVGVGAEGAKQRDPLQVGAAAGHGGLSCG
jgi:hypothetical protein